MHTIGGDWNDGMAIYHAISLSPCHITILGYASVCSMSSIILQAADVRLLMPDTDFMIHFGEMATEGYSLSVVSGADYERRLIDRMLDVYADVCVHGKFFADHYKILTREKVKRYIARKMKSRGDWHLSAEEAVYNGFADGILGQKNYEDLNTIRGK
jgi:ATP-dependent protease ClpP protease subunit